MLQPTRPQWWLLLIVAFVIVVAWPPSDDAGGDKSLAMKFVNWVVDPADELPTLPSQLPLGHGDDPDLVNARDAQTQLYDARYLEGGWTRRRLELKVASDPSGKATERQILSAIGVLAAFLAWRLAGRGGAWR